MNPCGTFCAYGIFIDVTMNLIGLGERMSGHTSIRRYGIAWILLWYALPLVSFQLGIESISPQTLKLFHNGDVAHRVGLITNQTSCDQCGNRTVDILRQKGLRIVYILAPEHGFDGKHLAGKAVSEAVDKATGIPIVSVYGPGGDVTITGKSLNPAIMRQLDMLVYDLQDSGMRHYTYISTLLCALHAAAVHNKPIIILDRPNILGAYMEGPLVDPYPELKSFISIAPIPLRHGMTVGELAHYFNKYILAKPAPLYVLQMKKYNRTMTVPFLRSLSPNLSTCGAVYGYSFLGILGEVEPFNVGVGTPYAFQAIMLPDACQIAPYVWLKVKAILTKYGITSAPHSAIHNKKNYKGLKLGIADGKKVASFKLLVELLLFFKGIGVNLGYSNTFDKAVGSRCLKELCNGTYSKAAFTNYIKESLHRFFKTAQDCYMYEPFPEIQEP